MFFYQMDEAFEEMANSAENYYQEQENLLHGAPERASINSGNNWKQSLIKADGLIKVQSEKQHTIWEVEK